MKPFPFLLASALFAQSLSLNSHSWNVTGWKVRAADLSQAGSSNIRLSNAVDGSLVFDFPVDSGRSTFQTVNYLYTKYTAPLGSQLTYALAITSTGAPVFQWKTEAGNNCDSAIQFCAPAAARPYFESSYKGTCASGQISVWCNRWWSANSYYVLTPGLVTLVILLDPAQWSTVNGSTGVQEIAAWNYALQNPTQIGITFGGGYFFGHGVYVTGGTAQFQLQQLSVQ